jgi:hypothetical protein
MLALRAVQSGLGVMAAGGDVLGGGFQQRGDAALAVGDGWALAYHPYPQNLFNPRAWEDEQAAFALDSSCCSCAISTMLVVPSLDRGYRPTSGSTLLSGGPRLNPSMIILPTALSLPALARASPRHRTIW